MKKIFFAFLALSFLFVSCKEETVILNQSGSLTFKVVDPEGKPVADARIMLFFDDYYYDEIMFDEKTNASGLCATGKLLQGTYYCEVEVTIEGKYYYIEKMVQVIAGKDKKVELKLIPYNNYYD